MKADSEEDYALHRTSRFIHELDLGEARGKMDTRMTSGLGSTPRMNLQFSQNMLCSLSS